jgi:hypothetical protein
MKKLFIYFLLLTMINSTFFVGENQDDKPFDGIEEVNEEEYNSVVEFVMEGCMDIPDETPEDEDDDIPDSFKPSKGGDSFCTPLFNFLATRATDYVIPVSFDISIAYSCFLDKNSPPPKLA